MKSSGWLAVCIQLGLGLDARNSKKQNGNVLKQKQCFSHLYEV